MSSKARALFKKLRSKANEEKEKERNETPEPNILRQVATFPQNDKKKFLSVPKNIKKEKDEDEIDPLEYFKTEHIKIQPSDMKEYAQIKEVKESDEEKEKEKNKIEINLKTGIIGPTSHKINFMDMMKARNKIKKNDNNTSGDKKKERKNLSVENKKNIKEEDNANGDKEKEDKNRNKSVIKRNIDSTQNLYVKLILARNRFNQNNVTEQNVYQNILNLVDELNSIKDLPLEYVIEINNLLQKLELPPHLIIDKDVQDYVPEDQFVPLIENPMPLDQVIKKLNISEN